MKNFNDLILYFIIMMSIDLFNYLSNQTYLNNIYFIIVILLFFIIFIIIISLKTISFDLKLPSISIFAFYLFLNPCLFGIFIVKFDAIQLKVHLIIIDFFISIMLFFLLIDVLINFFIFPIVILAIIVFYFFLT
jgi:hypothetical protein